jgi:hypothetical protein
LFVDGGPTITSCGKLTTAPFEFHSSAISARVKANLWGEPHLCCLQLQFTLLKSRSKAHGSAWVPNAQR